MKTKGVVFNEEPRVEEYINQTPRLDRNLSLALTVQMPMAENMFFIHIHLHLEKLLHE
ncbi:Uncharacterised protein [Vibrio cholerae]|nr:Uncharacterised protein [Vibrio cholerae]